MRKRKTLRERAIAYLNRRGSTTDGTTYWSHDQVDIFMDGYSAGYRAKRSSGSADRGRE